MVQYSFPSKNEVFTSIFMKSRYHIKDISVNNFKSFGNNTTINFTSQLNCVVGKNGCGKSALIDAICCCLGVDVKRLRCSKYAELITHLDTNTADKCTIQLEFQDVQNSRNVIRIAFSSDANGTTVYNVIITSYLKLPIQWKNSISRTITSSCIRSAWSANCS